MDYQDVVNLAANNDRLLMTGRALFGGDVTVEIRPVEVRQHGFNCASGGWGLMSGKTPARFLVYKRKARRKASTINVNDIKALEAMP